MNTYNLKDLYQKNYFYYLQIIQYNHEMEHYKFIILLKYLY